MSAERRYLLAVGHPPPPSHLGLLRSHTVKAKETIQLVGHCQRANKLAWGGKYYAQVSAPMANHSTLKHQAVTEESR